MRAVRTLVAHLAADGRATDPLLLRIDRHGRVTQPMTRGARTIADLTGRHGGWADGSRALLGYMEEGNR